MRRIRRLQGVVTLGMPLRIAACAQDAALEREPPPRSSRPAATALEMDVGEFEFHDDRGRSDRSIHIWCARPTDAGPSVRIVILLHGDSRTAQAARDLGAAHAAPHQLIVVAPHFRQEEYPS
jgi:hypothetical protein